MFNILHKDYLKIIQLMFKILLLAVYYSMSSIQPLDLDKQQMNTYMKTVILYFHSSMLKLN